MFADIASSTAVCNTDTTHTNTACGTVASGTGVAFTRAIHTFFIGTTFGFGGFVTNISTLAIGGAAELVTGTLQHTAWRTRIFFAVGLETQITFAGTAWELCIATGLHTLVVFADFVASTIDVNFAISWEETLTR